MSATVILAFAKQLVALLGAVAWPSAAVFIAGRFREPISAAIGRAQKVSAFGVEAQLPIQAQSEAHGAPASVEALNRSSAKRLTVSPYPEADPLLGFYEANLKTKIEEEDLTAEQRQAWLIRIAGSWLLIARHEGHYRLIYGSQIRFLRYLNQLGSLSYADAQAFFDADDGPKHDARITFEAWLGFLMNAGDVIVTGDTADQRVISITEMGRAFLAFLVFNGISEVRPF